MPSIVTAIRWASRLPLHKVVGTHDHRRPGFALVAITIASMVAVEPGSRFAVSSSRKGSGDLSRAPRERHPLLLPTGEIGRTALDAAGEPDGPEGLLHPPIDLVGLEAQW